MIFIDDSINNFAQEFEARVLEFLENSETDRNVPNETLARWLKEELTGLLTEYAESDDKDFDYDNYADPDDE